jgi:hypothetical protein
VSVLVVNIYYEYIVEFRGTMYSLGETEPKDFSLSFPAWKNRWWII